MIVGGHPEHPKTAEQNGHLGRTEVEELGSVDEQMLGDMAGALSQVVAESVSFRLEPGEQLDIGLLLRGVASSRTHRHRHLVPAGLGGSFDRGRAAKNNEVGHRHCDGGARLDTFEDSEHAA